MEIIPISKEQLIYKAIYKRENPEELLSQCRRERLYQDLIDSEPSKWRDYFRMYVAEYIIDNCEYELSKETRSALIAAYPDFAQELRSLFNELPQYAR